MIKKADLEPVFQAWYDHKMEPSDEDLAKQHRATLERIRAILEGASGQSFDLGDLRQALWPRFGQWMKENNLPPPPKG